MTQWSDSTIPMPKPLPLPPTVQDHWLNEFSRQTLPVREAVGNFINSASQAYDKYTPSGIKDMVKYFNESPDPIPGFVGDDVAKLALMPFISRNNSKAMALYKKILGFNPLEDIPVTRMQFEDPEIVDDIGNLVSHPSRGGVFVAPPGNPNSAQNLSAPASSPELFEDFGDLLEVKGRVKNKNPLVVPTQSWKSLVSDIPIEVFGKSYDNFIDHKFLGYDLPTQAKRFKGLSKKEIDLVNKSQESFQFTVNDFIRAKLAKQQGFDSIIPVSRSFNAYSGRRDFPEEMMLLPEKTVGNKIIRQIKDAWVGNQ